LAVVEPLPEMGTTFAVGVGPGFLHGLPQEHSTAATLRHDAVLREQQQHGNGHVQREIERLRDEPATTNGLVRIQRQDPDAGPVTTPAPAGGVTPPTGAPPVVDKPTFDFANKRQEGERFDSSYTPVGPVPAVGTLEVTLWVHVTFKNFTQAMRRQEPYRSHRFTPEQLRDFNWTEDEKQKFSADFLTSVQSAWSGKHVMHLNDPSFSEYRANVSISVLETDNAELAHTKITAQKVPQGAPRFRSFVGDGGSTATLDIRDPSEPETSQVFDRKLVRQIKPFGFDSAELNGLESQITAIESEIRTKSITPGRDAAGKEWVVIITGHASARGDRDYNLRLGLRRAEAVKAKLDADMGWGEISQVGSRGETNASNDEKFQRVDISIRSAERSDVTQNVAAHEAGHMFGLDDEYVEEEAPASRFFGDEPEHFGDVQAHLGTDAANETLAQDSGSIMSAGGDVKRGHYVYFLEALNQLTGKTWTVE
jgi:outer membrane protein OmpA-like peptidoglycan-associated protein